VSATVRTAQLNFTKTVRPILTERFIAGAQFEYTLTLSNVGQTPLRNVIISDPYPQGSLLEVSVDSGGVVSDREIIWEPATTPALEEIPPGVAVTLTINGRLNDTLEVGTEVLNQATARLEGGDPSLAPYPSDDPSTSAELDPTRLVIGEGAALRFTKDISEPVSRLQINPGDRITYQLLIENIGQRDSSVLQV
jgi:uncharacterized repeat protein (TIGR01451 family)